MENGEGTRKEEQTTRENSARRPAELDAAEITMFMDTLLDTVVYFLCVCVCKLKDLRSE